MTSSRDDNVDEEYVKALSGVENAEYQRVNESNIYPTSRAGYWHQKPE